jgi:hypothetical protein
MNIKIFIASKKHYDTFLYDLINSTLIYLDIMNDWEISGM